MKNSLKLLISVTAATSLLITGCTNNNDSDSDNKENTTQEQSENNDEKTDDDKNTEKKEITDFINTYYNDMFKKGTDSENIQKQLTDVLKLNLTETEYEIVDKSDKPIDELKNVSSIKTDKILQEYNGIFNTEKYYTSKNVDKFNQISLKTMVLTYITQFQSLQGQDYELSIDIPADKIEIKDEQAVLKSSEVKIKVNNMEMPTMETLFGIDEISVTKAENNTWKFDTDKIMDKFNSTQKQVEKLNQQ